MIIGYKLFRLKKDGSLTSLFINKTVTLPPGKWLKAKPHKTEGFSFRPGWHATPKPFAPHLTEKGRVWKKVMLKGVKEHRKPAAQGGLWYLATQMKILED